MRLSRICALDFAGGLLVPDDAVIYPPCAARYLLERATALGARLEVGRRVAEIEKDSVRFEDGTRLSAGAIVNAAGDAAARLTPGALIRGRKGHLLITDRYAGFVKHQLVELGYLKSAHSVSGDSVAFNVQPRSDGPNVDWIFAAIRKRGARSGFDNFGENVGARLRIYAGAVRSFFIASVDGISRRDAG